jgi:hypothetical protein
VGLALVVAAMILRRQALRWPLFGAGAALLAAGLIVARVL